MVDDKDGPEGADERFAREEARRLRDARERELLRQLAAGQLDMHSGSHALFRAFRIHVLKYFKFYGLSVADAEDQTQIVLVKIWENAKSYRGDASARTWVIKIAHNALIDYWRARKRSPPQHEDPEHMHEIPDQSPPAANLLDQLSWEDCYRREFARFAHDHPERAEAIRRQVLDQWTTEELARHLGRSPGATREFLSQSRTKLRGYLARCGEFRESLSHD